jgi:hypothetical protein
MINGLVSYPGGGIKQSSTMSAASPASQGGSGGGGGLDTFYTMLARKVMNSRSKGSGGSGPTHFDSGALDRGIAEAEARSARAQPRELQGLDRQRGQAEAAAAEYDLAKLRQQMDRFRTHPNWG